MLCQLEEAVGGQSLSVEDLRLGSVEEPGVGFCLSYNWHIWVCRYFVAVLQFINSRGTLCRVRLMAHDLRAYIDLHHAPSWA